MNKILLLIPLLLLVSCWATQEEEMTLHKCKIEAINECGLNNVYQASNSYNGNRCLYTCIDYSKYIR